MESNIKIVYLFKRLLLFLIFALGIYIILLFSFGSFFNKKYLPNLFYNLGHNYIRLNEVKETSGVDILFLGSSHAYRGFDTRIFARAGYETFNMGSSAQTPVQTRLLLHRYLDQLDPKLIIFEVNPMVFVSDGVESSIDVIINDNNDFKSFKMALGQNNIKVFNTFVYATLDQLFGPPQNYRLKEYIAGGYVSRKELVYNNNFNFKGEFLNFNPKQLKAFNDIIKIFHKKEIEYVLVQAPITKGRYASFTNIRTFDSIMTNYGKYYNYNNVLKLNDTIDFYDSHHLNQTGVDIFNKALIDSLKTSFKPIFRN